MSMSELFPLKVHNSLSDVFRETYIIKSTVCFPNVDIHWYACVRQAFIFSA